MGTSIVNTIVTAATEFATGFGGAVVDTFNTILTDGNGELSNLAIWALAFGGIGLIVGISKIFTRKIGN